MLKPVVPQRVPAERSGAAGCDASTMSMSVCTAPHRTRPHPSPFLTSSLPAACRRRRRAHSAGGGARGTRNKRSDGSVYRKQKGSRQLVW